MHGLECSHCLRQNLTGICPVTCSTLGMWKSLVPCAKAMEQILRCLLTGAALAYSFIKTELSECIILNGRYDSLKFSDYCNFNTSCTRAHSITLVPPQSTINSYRFSFFVNTVFLWNTVSYAILSLSAPKFRRAQFFVTYNLIYFVIYCNLFEFVLYFVLLLCLFVVSVM